MGIKIGLNRHTYILPCEHIDIYGLQLRCPLFRFEYRRKRMSYVLEAGSLSAAECVVFHLFLFMRLRDPQNDL